MHTSRKTAGLVLLALLLAFALLLPAAASAEDGPAAEDETVYAAGTSGTTSGYCGYPDLKSARWTLKNGWLTITGTGEINTKSARGVKADPWDKDAVVNLDIREGITGIRDMCFEDSTNLRYITLPDSLERIGAWAFEHCTAVESVHLEHVTHLDIACFRDCTSLGAVYLSDALPEIPGLCFINTDLRSISIPDSVKVLGFSCFEGCTRLSEVSGGTAPNVKIEQSAFKNCTSLTNISFPHTDEIGTGAFENCGITSVTVPGTVSHLTEGLFKNCASLQTVNINTTAGYIPADAFKGCANLSSLRLPDGLSEIQDGAFDGCVSLGRVSVPASVQTIGKRSFGGTGAHGLTLSFSGSRPSLFLSEAEFEFWPVNWASNAGSFQDSVLTVEYPRFDSTWTDPVEPYEDYSYDPQQGYGGTVTWTGVGELPSVSGVTAPKGTRTQGAKLTLKGTISAGSGTLSAVSARVYAASDASFSNALTGTEVSASGKTYSIKGNKLDTSCKLGTLPTGSYVYVITATVGGTRYELYRSSFTVVPATYTIRFDAKGGTGAPASLTKKYNVALDLTKTWPTRDGYTFQGWSESSTATSGEYRNSFDKNRSTTLYAVWSFTGYEVRYHLESGSVTKAAKEVGKALTIGCTDSKKGYDFLGWAKTKNASAPEFRNGDTYSQDTSLDLYPVFTLKIYTVTFDANGGAGAPAPQQKLHGSALTLSETVPTRDGYTFEGWSAGSGMMYQPGGLFTIDQSTTMRAVWRQNGTAVLHFYTPYVSCQYDAAAGTYGSGEYRLVGGFRPDEASQIEAVTGTSVTNDSYTYTANVLGKTVGELGLNPNGATLLALSVTSPDYDGEVYDVDNHRIWISGWVTAAGDPLTDETVIDFDGSVDVYPVWTREECRWSELRFDADGGSGQPGNLLRETGKAFTLPTQTPVMDGAEFLGWARTAHTSAPEYQPGETVTLTAQTTTFYAVWSGFKVCYKSPLDSYFDRWMVINDDEFKVDVADPAKIYEDALNRDNPAAEYTFLYWTDGESDTEYLYGETYPISGNLELTPVFKETADDFIVLPIQVRTFASYSIVPLTYTGGKDSLLVRERTKYLVAKNDGSTVEELGWIREDGSYPGYGSTMYPITGITADGQPLEKSTVIDASYQGLSAAFLFADSGYVLRYDANGGTGAPEPWYGAKDTAITLSETVPARYGYVFRGWTTDSGGTTAEYQPGDTYTVSGSCSLYAVWERATITLHLRSNGSDTILSGPFETYVTPADPAAREGYRFLGWAGEEGAAAPDYLPGKPILLEEDKDYYAVWEPLRCHLALHANDGSDLCLNSEHSCGDGTVLNAPYEREGAWLIGWAASADAAAPDFALGATITVTEDLDLYAVWGSPDFVLPASLGTVGTEAFADCAFTFVEIPAGVTRIGSRAFAGCDSLRCVIIAGADTGIDADAFPDLEGLTIFGVPDSPAESFARFNGFAFSAM